MIEVVTDPSLGVLLILTVAFSAIVVLFTREPWYDVAVRLAGFAAFLVGLRWVHSVEPDLGMAVLLAAGGFGLAVWSPKLPIPGRVRRDHGHGG